MKLRQLFLIAAGSLAVLAAPLAAQAPQAVRIPRSGVRVGGMAGGPGSAMWVGGAQTFDFIAAGPAFGGEVITNAPYSAEAVTETQQTLADGNKISRINSSKIYRDSQGRTRREQTIGAVGPWSSAGEPTELVFINDPVAGVNYVLNTKERTAQKTTVQVETVTHKIEDARAEKDVVEFESPAEGNAPGLIFRRMEREMNLRGEGQQHDVTVVHSAAATGVGFSDENIKTEPLGKQMIEGVEAEGTRTTITIPAGQIGNERPIETISESWFSAQLKTLVLSKQSDPRMGETTYRLTNLQLVEPLLSMFEAPAGYTIQEGPQMKFFERRLEGPKQGQAEPGR